MPAPISDTSTPPSGHFALDSGHNPVSATDWAEWMGGPLCARWVIDVPPTNVRAFTFFAGMPNEHGAFFWTNITSGRYHGRSGYAFTYAEAQAQHDRVVAWLRKRYQAQPTEE